MNFVDTFDFRVCCTRPQSAFHRARNYRERRGMHVHVTALRGDLQAHYHIPWGRDERRHWQEQSRPLQAGRAELRRRPGNRSCTRWKPDRTSLPVICRQCGTQGRWRALKTDCFRPGGVFIAASVVPISSFLWRIVGASRSKVKLHCCHGTNIHHLCDPFATNLYAICSPKRWRHLQTLR